MQKMTWKEEFSVGNRTLDDQHKKIIDMINEVRNISPDSKLEQVSEVVDKMLNYSLVHFEAEEKLMKESRYSGFPDHIKLHEAYQKKVVSLCEAATLQVSRLPEIIANYLEKWWEVHILQEDMKYKGIIDSDN